MKSILWGGHSAVLFNDTPSTYFACHKGVRQGDPLFLYLFWLVTEGLNKILANGIELDHFEELDPPILNDKNILNFEGLSGLKINFSKSELIALNINLASAHNFATQLHCKLDTLPLKYLDLSLHWKKPSRWDW
jgi:hypothetical protein